MSNNPSPYMIEQAYDLAASITPVSRQRVVAIIYDNNYTTRGIGFCQFKSHPLQKKYSGGNDSKIYLHAEIHALAQAFCKRDVNGRRLNNPTNILIVRLNTRNQKVDAFPCSSCELALREFGIHNIFWKAVS